MVSKHHLVSDIWQIDGLVVCTSPPIGGETSLIKADRQTGTILPREVAGDTMEPSKIGGRSPTDVHAPKILSDILWARRMLLDHCRLVPGCVPPILLDSIVQV